jgi:hypothetical protein
MSSTSEVTLRPKYVGEIPEPLDLTVTDADGVVVDCTGATAVQFKYTVDDGTTQQTGTAALKTTGADGTFRITWSGAEFATAGMLRGVCWFTLNGARLVAGVVTCRIITPPVTIS